VITSVVTPTTSRLAPMNSLCCKNPTLLQVGHGGKMI
jgi:hypothetical protein